jgi:quercetin dioxygenase-like cupin family protein
VEYHYHEFCKILILLSGAGSYFVEGKRYALKEGDVVLVGNQCVHRPEFEEGIPYERAILYIAPDFLDRQSTQDGDLKDGRRKINNARRT